MVKKIKVDGYNDLQFGDKNIYVWYEGKDGERYVETYKLIDVRKVKYKSLENKIRFEIEIDSIL